MRSLTVAESRPVQDHSAEKSPAPTAAATGDETFFGRMNDPTGAGVIQGSCGDTMEFYIVVQDETIVDVKFHTGGCANTRSCGMAAARRALGRKVTDALSISAGEIIRSGECEPLAGRHCAILAVSTLYRAIADYLLQP
jgi:nitrogen fixation protein NifU and related proteins